MKDETRVNHPPLPPLPQDNHSLLFPVYENVKWEFDSIDDSLRMIRGERDGYFYSRVSNPTVRQLELLLAGLQRRDDCVTCASGVNAIAQTLIALTQAGDHVLHFAEGYTPTRQLLRQFLARFGVRSTMRSIEDHAGIEQVLAGTPTRLVIFESPTNPVTKVADLAFITAAARRHGALTVLDNTFAGFHQHGEYDVDLFIHSLTKFATGAGDVMGGAVIGNGETMRRVRAEFRQLGSQLDPHSASLMVRGMKTYFVRYRAQSANALAVAQWLAARPEVVNVRYPGLPENRFHALASKQMRDFGVVVTFDLRAGAEAGRRFAEALALFANTASLGSTESLIVPPQMMGGKDLSPQEREWRDIRDGSIRLSIGIEDPADLLADLEQALLKA
jgi:cystathionine beta-lyase/cystathionine gamma-synthase